MSPFPLPDPLKQLHRSSYIPNYCWLHFFFFRLILQIIDMSSNRRPNGRTSGPPVVSARPEGKSKQIKLVLLGESGVGKSSIALRFVRGEFNENGEATIGGNLNKIGLGFSNLHEFGIVFWQGTALHQKEE